MLLIFMIGTCLLIKIIRLPLYLSFLFPNKKDVRILFLHPQVKCQEIFTLGIYRYFLTFPYDCQSVSIVLQPSPFFPKLYLPISYY